MKNLLREHKIKIILALVLVLALIYLGRNYFFNRSNFEIKNNNSEAAISSSGAAIKNKADENGVSALQEECENPNQRAIAVMLASDAITRPLSGISEADIVFEMPVVTDSITRFMAVYRCAFPKEIGSVRSARHDFIDLALAVDAIFAHWGGSHYALDRLKTGVIDDLDALRNPYSVFYRKSGILAPHNGFTSDKLLLNASQKLGYRMENNFKGYSRENPQPTNYNPQTITIGFPGEFKVEYQYDAKANSYLRWRGGKKEIDRNNNSQVAAKNIVTMFAESKQIEGQYNDVKLEGEGKANFYKNGERVEGVWKRDVSGKDPKLYFLDSFGAEIKFAPGNIWVEILQTNQKAEWNA